MGEMHDDNQALLPFDDGSTGRVIRHVWHDGRWFFSVIDVVAVLTDSPVPRTYFFRAAQTTAKLKREGTDSKADANKTHFTVGREVRETIARLDGTMPEDLSTPEQSIFSRITLQANKETHVRR